MFKVPVLYTLMQQVDAGLVDLDEVLDPRTWPALGSGALKYLTSLSRVSLRDLAHLAVRIRPSCSTKFANGATRGVEHPQELRAPLATHRSARTGPTL